MEVKIKQGKEMIDATIEMVDGVMVVSPKEVKFEPKDGDVVNADNCICIFKKERESVITSFESYIILNNQQLRIGINVFYAKFRPATEEEKKKLFDKLAEEGLAWDAEKKEIVKLKWKPKEGEQCWYPFMYIRVTYSPMSLRWNIGRDRDLLNKGWYFKTEQESQEFCDRLNEAISQVK